MPEDRGSVFGKLFAHGIAFSFLLVFLSFAWAVVLVFLVICGLFIGLILGVILLFVLMGWLNALLTAELWFPVKRGFWTLTAHGLVMFIALLPLDLVGLGVQLAVGPDLGLRILAVVAFYVVTAPVVGWIGRGVAGIWRLPEPPSVDALPPDLLAPRPPLPYVPPSPPSSEDEPWPPP